MGVAVRLRPENTRAESDEQKETLQLGYFRV
jgi:hypothetical protein